MTSRQMRKSVPSELDEDELRLARGGRDHLMVERDAVELQKLHEGLLETIVYGEFGSVKSNVGALT